MTRPGLLEQNELNVQLLDFGGDESKKYFDTLWDTGCPGSQSRLCRRQQDLRLLLGNLQ